MARRKQETLVLFPDLFEGTAKLTDAQFGALIRGVFRYRFEDQLPEFTDPMVDMAFAFMKPQIDRYRQICQTNRENRQISTNSPKEDTVQGNATESQETEENPTHTHTHNHTHTQNHTQNHTHTQSHTQKEKGAAKPPGKNIPPTLEEVKQYCQKRSICIDPQRFIDYYTANGWMVGRTKMKDWHAALRTWNTKEKPDGKTENTCNWVVGTVL